MLKLIRNFAIALASVLTIAAGVPALGLAV